MKVVEHYRAPALCFSRRRASSAPQFWASTRMMEM